MTLYKTNKQALLFRNNAPEFLNGLTSNSMDRPRNAFLSIHGKIIATFDQLKIDDETVLICIEKLYVPETLKHLDRYVKLSGVKVEQLPHHVYFDLAGDYAVGKDEYSIAQKKGQLVISNQALEARVSDDEFTQFRLNNAIPVHGIDYKDEFLLNVSTSDHVSFTKGCYLGQEPVSKVYNRSKPTWKLVVKQQEDSSEEEKGKMTSTVRDSKTGKARGFVFVKNV